MDFFSQSRTVVNIAAAVNVIQGTAQTTHINRPSHGFALFYGGSATYHFASGEVISVEKGECIYMPKYSTYTVEQSTKIDRSNGCYAVNFQILEDGVFTPIKIRPKNASDILTLFQNIERRKRQKSEGFTEICLSDLYKAIYILKNEHHSTYFTSREMTLIAPALDYISQHMTAEDISVPSLARICEISEPYLRRLFSTCLGVSPIEYIRRQKLLFAKELLESLECSVSHAASSAGFNDVSYFSREFKKLFGISPKNIKNTQGENNERIRYF